MNLELPFCTIPDLSYPRTLITNNSNSPLLLRTPYFTLSKQSIYSFFVSWGHRSATHGTSLASPTIGRRHGPGPHELNSRRPHSQTFIFSSHSATFRATQCDGRYRL